MCKPKIPLNNWESRQIMITQKVSVLYILLNSYIRKSNSVHKFRQNKLNVEEFLGRYIYITSGASYFRHDMKMTWQADSTRINREQVRTGDDLHIGEKENM